MMGSKKLYRLSKILVDRGRLISYIISRKEIVMDKVDFTNEELEVLWRPWNFDIKSPIVRKLIKLGLLNKCMNDVFRTRKGSAVLGFREFSSKSSVELQ
jgi:hypothetical protein